MKKRKGMTLIMLVIYIIVVFILGTVIVSNFMGDESIKETTLAVFEAKISDYIEEFDTRKNYCIINNIATTNYSIDDYIPSITATDKLFLDVQNNQLVFFDIDLTDTRYQVLIDLGLTERQ